MLSKLNLKVYKGKLISFNPNLNRGTFPTEEQVNQIFHDHKNALSQVFRIEIENPKTFTQTTFVMKHSKAYGIASDYDAKELHCGAMVQIQGYYNPDNDLHTAIGMQIWTKNKPAMTSEKDINQSEVALSHTEKASKANSASNSVMEKIVRQRASESIAKEFNKSNSVASIASQTSHQSRATTINTNNRHNNNYFHQKHNQQMLDDIDNMKQNSDQSNQSKKINKQTNSINSSNNDTSETNKSTTSSQVNKLNDKRDEINIQSMKSKKNQQESSQGKKSVSNKSSIPSLNSTSSNTSSQSTDPSNVISSAMKQVREAGYNVQSFGDSNTNTSATSQTVNSNIDSVSAQQSSMLNNSQNDKSQNIQKTSGSVISKSTNSDSNGLLRSSMSQKSGKNQESETNNNKNKRGKQSSIAPFNFLPQHSLSSASKISKASQNPDGSKSSTITSIASKYQVPKSMAIIKYKIMQKSSMSASKSNAKIRKMKSLKSNNKESMAFSTSSNKKSDTDKDKSQSLGLNHSTKLKHIKKQQKYYKQIDNRETNTLQQLKQLQKENKKSKLTNKDIPTTKEITKKVQKKQLPSMHLSKHGKQIQQAYQQVMNSKHMTTEQLDDKLRDIYRLEGWDSFFEQDTKTFLYQLKGDLNRILKGEDVRYPLSYNNIPNINEIEKLTKLQEKQDKLNKKGDK